MPTSHLSTSPVIVWFRRDLRVADNPALTEAAAMGCPVIPVYLLEEPPPRPMGDASRWWLHHSLKSLCRELARLGAQLILRRGRAIDIIPCLAAGSGARAVLWNRRHDPTENAIDTAVASILEAGGIGVRQFNTSLLFDPEAVRNRQSQPFQIFTPFWRHCLSLAEPSPPLPGPPILVGHAELPSERLTDWGLLPRSQDWTAGLGTAWTPGEDAAAARLTDFVDGGLPRYAQRRDLPDQDGTSRLSPYLAFGEISPRQVWQAARTAGTDPAEGFLRELGWREFCHHTLYHFPALPEEPLRREFREFPWTADEDHWNAFIAGHTGYPIIDAGMRALWETGWLHNRLRMIVASFLVKDLLITWRRGQDWFRDTLVDADVANNACGWQWVTGCGVESAPYFRIFNPVIQGEKYDPRGRYVRRWVPELSKLPDLYIHQPWVAPPEVLAKAGVALGRDYPRPIIEHNTARRRALLAYERIRGAA